MATKTTAKDENKVLESLGIETVESVPKRQRGRQVSTETKVIMSQIEACEKDGKARSFSNVDESEREVWARKVRAAAKALATSRNLEPNAIKTSTVYDPDSKKLFWGTDEVIKKLQKATNTAA